MKSNIEQKIYSNLDHLLLFKSFAESLKLPLLQIKSISEVVIQTKDTGILNDQILANKKLAELIDNYLLSVELSIRSQNQDLETLSLSSALSDVAHLLYLDANKNRIDIELDLRGKYGPVIAHSKGLKTALSSLGRVLIEAQSEQEKSKRSIIKLAAHKTGYGVVAGVYADSLSISTSTFNNAKKLKGKATIPFGQLTSTSASNIFIADALLKSMDTNLRMARFSKMSGLAATFQASKQLELI